MAQVDYDTTARNAQAEALAALFNGGVLALIGAGPTDLALIALDGTNAFETAGTGSAGVARALGDDGTNPIGSGNPLTGAGEAAAAGGTTVTSAELRTSGGAARMVLDVSTVAAGTGAVQLVNLSVASTQPIEITALSITAPATVTWTP